MILLGFNGGGEGCLEEEREALVKLKEAFNHPHGSSLPSWNNVTNHSDCCTWERVHCDNSTHRVIELDLSGTRAEELGHIKWSLNVSYFLPFHQLQILDLSGNYLSGLFGDIRLDNLEDLSFSVNELKEAPSFDLSHSRNLKMLDLSSNSLEGTLPESITSLTSLADLFLEDNNLNGSLPQRGGLCDMKNLAALDLNSNKFEGQLPACIGNLTSLHILALRNNGFEGTFPSSLFQALRSLVLFSLSDDNFNGSFSLSLLANHSNLQIFRMECYNANLKLETENPPFIPSFQLRVLRIHNCTLVANNNKMPTFLLHQYDLLSLQLSHLSMTGIFPSWLLTNNTELNYFSLANNLFTGPFELNSTSKLLQMQFFNVSSNPIEDEVPSHIGSFFPNLISLDMSSCSLRGSFPASIGEMTQLNDLDLSHNNLSGYLPQEFGRASTELRFVPTGIINSTELRMLDLSANQLSGEIPSWIGNFQHMSYLILSKNSFTGSLPKSFCNLTRLTYLELSKNKFNGSLPSCLNMPLLKYLHLQSNQFTGPIPSTLANSSLLTLDFTNNNFSGQVPRLFSLLLNLRVLILKENKFNGSIPIDLCELKKINILDLSQNKLSGRIPYCLNNVAFGKKNAPRETNIGNFNVSWTTRGLRYTLNAPPYKVSLSESKEIITLSRDQEVDFTTKSRHESYKGNILNFMSGLDLSGNQLTGEIPSQIGYLSTIHTLNLSKNDLKGPIPVSFSNLKQIESLDLSHNKSTGHIPAQLTQLYFLSIFSVAHNNLSGRIPDMKNQFSTFEPNSYEGNPFLCGPPLQKNCSSIDKLLRGNKQPHHSEDEDFQNIFLWTFAGAFGISFETRCFSTKMKKVFDYIKKQKSLRDRVNRIGFGKRRGEEVVQNHNSEEEEEEELGHEDKEEEGELIGDEKEDEGGFGEDQKKDEEGQAEGDENEEEGKSREDKKEEEDGQVEGDENEEEGESGVQEKEAEKKIRKQDSKGKMTLRRSQRQIISTIHSPFLNDRGKAKRGCEERG
ncbi:receptor-like protein 9b [Prosopis cineraria]|uniref:receptor-like protein 9b n=1 Tax=Prosopis cineraria TaxID=364024 RepID=UPI00241097B5|nr:receptor-like protein 9b [Prosopis cineraria]